MITLAYLGMPQIIIIMVLVLIIFGPSKVPEIARQIGQAMREMKKMSNEVQQALNLDEHLSYDSYSSTSYNDHYSAPSYDYHASTSYDAPLDQHGLVESETPALIASAEAEPAAAIDHTAVSPVTTTEPAPTEHVSSIATEPSATPTPTAPETAAVAHETTTHHEPATPSVPSDVAAN